MILMVNSWSMRTSPCRRYLQYYHWVIFRKPWLVFGFSLFSFVNVDCQYFVTVSHNDVRLSFSGRICSLLQGCLKVLILPLDATGEFESGLPCYLLAAALQPSPRYPRVFGKLRWNNSHDWEVLECSTWVWPLYPGVSPGGCSFIAFFLFCPLWFLS